MTPNDLVIRIVETLLVEADNERRLTLELWLNSSDMALLSQSPEVREGKLWTARLFEDAAIPPLHARAVRGAAMDDRDLPIMEPASSSLLAYFGD